MKPKKTFLILILCVALFTTYSSLKHIFNLENTTYDVRIINGFSNNSSLPLVVWCVSQDWGDIGGRALQERDDYSWIIKTKGFFWSSYRFVCTMKWDSRRKKFEAFQASRDKYRCGANRQCFWLVKEDGFYFSNNGVDWIKDFSWV
ncbi:hypothetical protein CDL12_11819 [Handroanthus impetiginosus]|uniref:Uncharacterized protein n=1 Tax=Handroanthus impetiginosus TaxID=429701 RepID=A0A2G9HDC3_9LAMI|nr:hypothetical protein CDL12_11819 [Handroanthus impetiginosus]